ncbi:MAG: thiamine biosynthesis protein ThiI [bacterium]|jgi:thiamine biosynthesis protein ThiI
MKFIVIRYAEIALKGGNRKWFENKLINNIRKHTSEITDIKIHRIHGRIYLELETGFEDDIVDALQYVPGIANFSISELSDHNLENIQVKAVELIKKYIEKTGSSSLSFKVASTRSYKAFPMNSIQISQAVGAHILPQFSELSVDLHNPEFALQIEIWNNNKSIVFLEKIQGQGGLPVGSSGSVLSFLSGGIDSPVASWMIMKRGCRMVYLNFHSYPFIGEQSRQKVIDLVQQLSRYQPKSILLIAPFTEIQKQIKENCTERYRTLLYRRMMVRIGERIKDQYHVQAYVTGEAVGQVASQTLANIKCTEEPATLPILRPLIGMDKAEIITLAKKIETYPISIQPFPDCCTVFQPSKPETQGQVKFLHEEESKFDFEALIDEAVANIEEIQMDTSIEQQFLE